MAFYQQSFLPKLRLFYFIGILALNACSHSSEPGAIYSAFPQSYDADGRYLIYLHGKIIEDQGVEQAMSPDFGPYAYADILSALAVEGLHVISEVRPKDAEAWQFALELVERIGDMREAGIPASQITIVGVSKGGAITILAANRIQETDLQFVLLAGCSHEIRQDELLSLPGRVLSIYEASDDSTGSCQPLAERSSPGSTFEEIILETGRGHGEFYQPRSGWIDPTLLWALGDG